MKLDIFGYTLNKGRTEASKALDAGLEILKCLGATQQDIAEYKALYPAIDNNSDS